MKTIKFYVIIAALVFATASCVENSGKYKTVVAQRDSVEHVKQALDSSYSQTLIILDEIESGFNQINQSEKDMKVNLKGVEGNKTIKKEVIAAQMTAIKEGIDKNKAKIAELRRLASKNLKENSRLIETIKRLQTEMDEKAVQIQSLQAELEQKNIKITELTSTVDVQSKNIAEQQNVMAQQKSTINDLNTVWYCVAKFEKLKDAKIVSNTGLFQTKKVMAANFDKNAFTTADLRNLSSIPTNSENIKIITTHPKGSYNLVTGADKKITIVITDQAKFWSVSRYLVVQL